MPLNLVCFRFRPSDIQDESQLNTLNEQLLRTLNDSGEILLTQTRLNGKYALRLVAGQTEASLDDVRNGWAQICRVAATLK